MTDVNAVRHAFETQCHGIVNSVLSKLGSRADVEQSTKDEKVNRLKELWLQNLTSAMQVSGSKRGRAEHTHMQADISTLVKHRRLIDVVPRLSSAYGCVGTPAPCMQRPTYHKLSEGTRDMPRPTHVISGFGNISAVRAELPSLSSAVDGSTANTSWDLLIGMQVHVNLPVLLQKDAGNFTPCWIPARVVKMLKTSTILAKRKERETISADPKQQLLTVTVRFHNGAELSTHWPNNPHIRAWVNGDSVDVGSAGSTCTGPGQRQMQQDIQSRTLQNVALHEEPVPVPVDGDHMVPSFPVEGRSASAADALRILLGEDDGGDEGEDQGAPQRGLLNSVFAGGSRLLAGLGVDSDSEGGEDAVLGGGGAEGDLLALLGLRGAGAVGGSGGGSGSAGVGGRRGDREGAVLATGERVLASQLSEIEQHFHSAYRPRWRWVPDQHSATDGELLSGASRRQGFVSRQWVRGVTTDRANMRVDGQAEVGQQLQTDLRAVEDPTVPLSEPEVVIIGRAVKKVPILVFVFRWLPMSSLTTCIISFLLCSCCARRTGGTRCCKTCTSATCGRQKVLEVWRGTEQRGRT